MAASDIIIGARFTRWTVSSLPFKIKYRQVVSCRCDCGAEKSVRISKLRNGTSRSCGCFRNDSLTTHGMTAKAVRKDSHEYWIWNMIVQRCRNPKVRNWGDYGGRGIDVCDRWLSFENFLADMGPRPSKAHSIERRNNAAGYHKDNCKWATRLEQGKNKRNNHLISAFGKTQHLAEWAREYGIQHTTILYRIRAGWPVEDAVSRLPA